MSFKNRMQAGLRHESVVLDAIRRHGWIAETFGQALFSAELRGALREWDTRLRWMPDLLCVRPTTDSTPLGDCVRLVDAKWSNRQDTPYYDFEVRSVLSHQRWYTNFEHHVWLVFYDLRCCRVADACTSPRLRKGVWNGSGSGTPFYLLPKDDDSVRDLDDAFGRCR